MIDPLSSENVSALLFMAADRIDSSNQTWDAMTADLRVVAHHFKEKATQELMTKAMEE